MDSLLKAFTGWLSELRAEQAREELGASHQREGDLNAEMDRITKSVAVGSNPSVTDPSGMRDDPNNRDNQP